MSIDDAFLSIIEDIDVTRAADGRFAAFCRSYPRHVAYGNTREEAIVNLYRELFKVVPRLQSLYYREMKAKLLEDLKSELGRRGVQAGSPVRVKGRHEVYEVQLSAGKIVFYLKYGAIGFWGADLRFLEQLGETSHREEARCFLVLLGRPGRNYCIPLVEAIALAEGLSISRDGQVKIEEKHLDYRWEFSTVSALVDSILSE